MIFGALLLLNFSSKTVAFLPTSSTSTRSISRSKSRTHIPLSQAKINTKRGYLLIVNNNNNNNNNNQKTRMIHNSNSNTNINAHSKKSYMYSRPLFMTQNEYQNGNSNTTSTSSSSSSTSSSTSSSKTPAPASQLESIIKNAKVLNPLRAAVKSMDAASSNTNTSTKLKQFSATFAKSSLSGLTVALAMIPEATAFAFVAGVNPLVGLWTTVLLGFTAAMIGGRPGICSSTSGACSIVVASLGLQYGPEYLSVCAILAGALQIIGGGTLGLGKFVRLVPHPVMLGFVNGLAILMTKAQLVHFQGVNPLANKAGASLYGITALTMLLCKLIPKMTTAIPSTLGAVVLSALVAHGAKLPVKTLADAAGASTFTGGLAVLPTFRWWPQSVPLSLETLKIVLPFAATMAAVGAIESLLTMQLVDG